MLSDDDVKAHVKTIADMIRKDDPPQAAEEKAALKAVCAIVADVLITMHKLASSAERAAEALTRLADVAERVEIDRAGR